MIQLRQSSEQGISPNSYLNCSAKTIKIMIIVRKSFKTTPYFGVPPIPNYEYATQPIKRKKSFFVSMQVYQNNI